MVWLFRLILLLGFGYHTVSVFLSDPERNVDDWIALGKPTLVLKCQQLGLSQVGTLNDLANSLCSFYDSSPRIHTNSSSISADAVRSSSVPARVSTSSTTVRSSGARSRRNAPDPNAIVVQSLLDANPAHLVSEPLVSVANVGSVTVNSSIQAAVSDALREKLSELIPSIIDSCTGSIHANIQRSQSAAETSPVAGPSSFGDTLPWVQGRGLVDVQQSFPFRNLSSADQYQHGKRRRSKKSKKKSKKRKLAKMVFSSSSSSSSSSDSDVDRRPSARPNRVSLPPLDSTLIKRIASGKKVDFDLLLPCSSALRSEGFELRHSQGDGAFYFAPKSRTKAKVSDFFTWCQAWSVFALYYTFYHAHRAAELWGYFHLASEFATQFVWSNFENYDFQFRTSMDEDRKKNLLRWDRIDENLKSRFLTVSKPVCFSCRNFGHRSPQCPQSTRRAISHVNFESSTQSRSSSSASANKKSTTKDKIYYCFNFNNGNCDDAECKYSHTCQNCGKDHAKVHCPSRN